MKLCIWYNFGGMIKFELLLTNQMITNKICYHQLDKLYEVVQITTENLKKLGREIVMHLLPLYGAVKLSIIQLVIKFHQ